MAPYTTYQIGGLADYFLEAETREELLAGAQWAQDKNCPVFVFGGGSNLLFDDEGFRGLVIRVKSNHLTVEGSAIQADAGGLISKLVEAAAKASLTGLEAWNGLPGTVGGAVYGNAGCFGVECKDVLESAELFIPWEGVKTVKVSFFRYGYRYSSLKEKPAVILSARFKLEKGDPAKIQVKMKEIAKSRIQKQPAGLNTGSFFKNPSKEKPAGWLIEQCGLKGKQIGGGRISEQHANFFVNRGGAKAADILVLADLAAREVQEKFGITLEREVIFVPAKGGGLIQNLAR